MSLSSRLAGSFARFADATVSAQDALAPAWKVAGLQWRLYMTTKMRVIFLGVIAVAAGTYLLPHLGGPSATGVDVFFLVVAGATCGFLSTALLVGVFAVLYVPLKQRNALKNERLASPAEDELPEVKELREDLADGQTLLARMGSPAAGIMTLSPSKDLRESERSWREKTTKDLAEWPREQERFRDATSFAFPIGALHALRINTETRMNVLRAAIARITKEG